jgi:hypothetical protein
MGVFLICARTLWPKTESIRMKRKFKIGAVFVVLVVVYWFIIDHIWLPKGTSRDMLISVLLVVTMLEWYLFAHRQRK